MIFGLGRKHNKSVSTGDVHFMILMMNISKNSHECTKFDEADNPQYTLKLPMKC